MFPEPVRSYGVRLAVQGQSVQLIEFSPARIVEEVKGTSRSDKERTAHYLLRYWFDARITLASPNSRRLC
jgi:hypothetical protein